MYRRLNLYTFRAVLMPAPVSAHTRRATHSFSQPWQVCSKHVQRPTSAIHSDQLLEKMSFAQPWPTVGIRNKIEG